MKIKKLDNGNILLTGRGRHDQLSPTLTTVKVDPSDAHTIVFTSDPNTFNSKNKLDLDYREFEATIIEGIETPFDPNVQTREDLVNILIADFFIPLTHNQEISNNRNMVLRTYALGENYHTGELLIINGTLAIVVDPIEDAPIDPKMVDHKINFIGLSEAEKRSLSESTIEIWSYQDMEVQSINLTITTNENGSDATFNPLKIVDGSAFVISDDNQRIPIKKGNVFVKDKKIVTANHIGVSVTINDVPTNKNIRVWYKQLGTIFERPKQGYALPQGLYGDSIESIKGYTPVGSIVVWPSDHLPEDWLLLDGGSFNKSNYPRLYEILGNDVLPDFRDQFIRGATQNRSVLSMQNDSTRMPNNPFGTNHSGNHAHALPHYRSNGANWGWGNLNGAATDPQHIGTAWTTTQGNHNHAVTGGDSETRPKNISVHFIIKAR